MKKTLVAVLALGLLVFALGCGESSSSSKSKKKTSASKVKKKAKKGASSAAADVPSYEEVKALALEEPALKASCDKQSKVLDIGAPEQGEVYKRLLCGGREALDYVVGSGQYRRNFTAARELAFAPLWSKPGEAYVKVSVSGQKGLAGKIRQSCGCGEVVAPD